METKSWTKCHIDGYIVACDPGNNNLSYYPADYTRGELKVGMNLCAHDKDLPKVIVKKIADNSIVVRCSNSNHTITIGEEFYSPRKGLSYAYSEAIISLE